MTQQEIALLERQVANYKSAGVLLKFSNTTPDNNELPVLKEIVDLRQGTSQPFVIECSTLNNGNIVLGHDLAVNVWWKESRLNPIYFENCNIGKLPYGNIQLASLNQSVQNLDYLRNLTEYIDDNLLRCNGVITLVNKLLQWNYAKYQTIKNCKNSTEFMSLANEWYYKKLSFYSGAPVSQNTAYYKVYDVNKHNISELYKLQITKLPPKVAETIKAKMSRAMKFLIHSATQDKNTLLIIEQSEQEMTIVAKSLLEICALAKQYGQSIYPKQL
jgi:hypothetical protein